MPGGEIVQGRLERVDDFLVTVGLDDGTTRTIRRDGDSPAVEITDPMQRHNELLAVFTNKNMHDVTAYLHGRDNVPGRRLLDGSGAVVFDRLVFDVFDACAQTIDPIGDPADWEGPQAQPGRFWQVDAGAVALDLGSYAIVTVTEDAVLFELFAYLEGDDVLVDSWSILR